MRLALTLSLAGGLFALPLHAASTAEQSSLKQAKSEKKNLADNNKGFRIYNPDTLMKPTAGYSQVAEVSSGKMVFISGQIAVDRSGNLVGKDDFRAQVQQVFENLNAAVQAAGGDFHDVIKLNIYCTENVDPTQFPIVREVRDKYVNASNPPTSTFLVVKRLVRPEWMIEVEAVAVVKK